MINSNRFARLKKIKIESGAAVILKILRYIESRYIKNRRNVTDLFRSFDPSLSVYSRDFQRVIDGTKFQEFRKGDKDSQELSSGYVAGNDVRRLRRGVDNGDIVYHKFPGRILRPDGT